MATNKSLLFLVPALSLTLMFSGCGKERKHEKDTYHKEKKVSIYPDFSAKHSKEKGIEHRKKAKDKYEDTKSKAKEKVCNMCGGTTKKGKCSECLKKNK